MLIKLYDNWINPENITYLEEGGFEGVVTTRINFVGGSEIEIMKSQHEVIQEMTRVIRETNERIQE